MTPADRLREIADFLDANGITEADGDVHVSVDRVPLASVEAVGGAFTVERVPAHDYITEDYLRARAAPGKRDSVTLFTRTAPPVQPGNPYSDLNLEQP